MILKYFDFVNEIVDYDSSYHDINEYPEIINRNYYLFSDRPLTLEEVKREGDVAVKFSNVASASSSDSEYIYQVKLKKPVYKKKSLSNSFFDSMFSEGDTEFDDSKYSGYFKKDWISNDLVAIIKTDHIVNFRYIGGFVKYDKKIPKKIMVDLSEETERFLHSYIGGTILHKKVTPEIIKELKRFKPKSSIKIYKGIEEIQIRHQTDIKPPYKKGQIIYNAEIPHCSSWTSNILVARTFIDDYPSSQPFVVTRWAQPKNILVDVRMLPDPSKYYEANQREIIMLPGIYNYKIVWAGK
jgi:hypothetical protein